MIIKNIFKKEPGNFINPSLRAITFFILSYLVLIISCSAFFNGKTALIATFAGSLILYFFSCLTFNHHTTNKDLSQTLRDQIDKEKDAKKKRLLEMQLTLVKRDLKEETADKNNKIKTVENYLLSIEKNDKEHQLKIKDLLSKSEINKEKKN